MWISRATIPIAALISCHGTSFSDDFELFVEELVAVEAVLVMVLLFQNEFDAD